MTMLNWLLVFVAVLSVSRGQDCVGSLQSILDKVKNIERDISMMITTSSVKLEYMGCYVDDANRMIKEKYRNPKNDLTIDWCFAFCRESNYRYAAVQAGYACFCGNTIDTRKYPKRPDSECNRVCRGNAHQICGGGWRNSLYKLI